ncbi:MAG TPA: hypothetical protein VGR70_21925 [Stellaceae bacterium]|nr:hypothetical protein [Stellaceae bacterium]
MEVRKDETAIVKRHRITLIEADRLVEVGERAVVVLQVPVGVAAIVIGIGIARIELYRLGEIGDRMRVIALVLIGIVAIVKAMARFFWVSRPDWITAVQPLIARSTENRSSLFTHHCQFCDVCALAGDTAEPRVAINP